MLRDRLAVPLTALLLFYDQAGEVQPLSVNRPVFGIIINQIAFGEIRAVYGEDIHLAHAGFDLRNKRLRIGAGVHIPNRVALRIVFETDPCDYI